MCKNLLGQPTDADLDQLPHVLLTGPHEWDPSVLDYTHPATGTRRPLQSYSGPEMK